MEEASGKGLWSDLSELLSKDIDDTNEKYPDLEMRSDIELAKLIMEER